MKRGFVNQKLGKRNSRRAQLQKAKITLRPSGPPSRASNRSEGRSANRGA
jgi:hypothetical protein